MDNSNSDGVEETKKRVARSTTSFLGVRQRPSGRWVSEIKVSSQKMRLWLGTYDRPEEAAKAYDSAARLVRGRNAKTNFPFVHEEIDIPSKRFHQLMQHRGCLTSCVHETVVCCPDHKMDEVLSSSGGSRVYSSVVVAPSFGGDGLCQLEEGNRC